MRHNPALAPLFQEHECSGLEPLLQRLLSIGRAAWPDVPLPAEHFVRHLRRHCPPDADPLLALPRLNIEDLYLACACAHQLDEALRLFDRHYLAPVKPVLMRREADAALADEVCQRLREHLFVSREAPRIGQYAGRGSLMNWVRNAAIWDLLDLQRQRGAAPVPFGEDAAAALSGDLSPELAIMKRRDREVFQQALHEALHGLPGQERALLRLCYVEGLSLDRIAVSLDMHRSSVNRRILKARAAVERATRKLLSQRLQLSAAGIDSLVELVRSQIDLDLAGALASDPSLR